jgi:hypothetical protein
VPNARLFLLLFYVIVAAVLRWRIVTRFDRWLDRPKLSATACADCGDQRPLLLTSFSATTTGRSDVAGSILEGETCHG